MENIPDPKYKIGDWLSSKIDGFGHSLIVKNIFSKDNKIHYLLSGWGNDMVIDEDQIIKKLN